jgi:rhamnose utilization protein RhaD (predicted bifunctional aldolase and dehydrogenase)
MRPHPIRRSRTLLHAFLPHKFVDHTHSTAVLALTDQPDGEAIARDTFGSRMAYVPYTIPGFDLAKSVAQVYGANPKVEGLILLRHGIFTFAEGAREAYDLMIEMVTLAEEQLKRGKKTLVPGEAARTPCFGRRYCARVARRQRARQRQEGRRCQAPDPLLPHRRGYPQLL